MNCKKRFFLICTCSILGIGVIIVALIKVGAFFADKPDRNNKETDIDKDSLYLEYVIDEETDVDKDRLYFEYIIKTVEEAVQDEKGVQDCKIDVKYLDGKITSVDVSIVMEGDGSNFSKDEISDYISQSLEVSIEDITLSFE